MLDNVFLQESKRAWRLVAKKRKRVRVNKGSRNATVMERFRSAVTRLSKLRKRVVTQYASNLTSGLIWPRSREHYRVVELNVNPICTAIEGHPLEQFEDGPLL